MPLRVAAWNAEGMFVPGSKNRRGSTARALKTLKQLQADLVFVPEFGDTARVDGAMLAAIHSLGYTPVVYSYEQPELGSYGAALLTRLPLRAHTLRRFGSTGRRYIEATLASGLNVIGLHLDDRTEALRMEQVKEVGAVIGRDKSSPTVVLGDFNAMPARSCPARLVRRRGFRAMRYVVPGVLLKSVVERVHQMGYGTAMAYLQQHTGLINADTKNRPTISAKQAGLEWLPAWRLAKIDHILVTPDIAVRDYTVHGDAGSDHRPISAQLILR